MYRAFVAAKYGYLGHGNRVRIPLCVVAAIRARYRATGCDCAIRDLASGLSILCGGSAGDRVAAAFSLYDYNADGFISLDEMIRFLTCVFKVLFEVRGRISNRSHWLLFSLLLLC